VTDQITLTGLRVRGFHGVHGFERIDGQDFVIDVTLAVDLAPAGRSDDVADTVDYGSLAQRVAAIVSGQPVRLIETLADRIATSCLSDQRVSSVTVTVHKPQAPIELTFSDVSVTVVRTGLRQESR
jgi:dihydroneopterin aldolase